MSTASQRVTSLRRRAQANAPVAPLRSRRVPDVGGREDWTGASSEGVPGRSLLSTIA